MKMKAKLIALGAVCVLLAGCGQDKAANEFENKLKEHASTDVVQLFADPENDGHVTWTVLEAHSSSNIYSLGIETDEVPDIKELFDTESGELEDGYTFVTVKMRMQNIDAISGGIFPSWCGFSDDTFRADSIWLADVQDAHDVPDFWQSVRYFDSPDFPDIHSMAFTLAIGDSKEYTIGFLTDAPDMQHLYLTNCTGGYAGDFVPLVIS